MQNNTLTWVLGIILVILLVGGAYYLGINKAAAPEQKEEIQQTVSVDETIIEVPPHTWILTEGDEDATGAPMTRVAILFNGEVHELDSWKGSCSEIAGSSWTLVEGEFSGVICWWAGGGTELGLFREEDGDYVIKLGLLEEGTAEGGGFRGNFSTAFSL